MMTLNRYIAKRGNEYLLIEQNINPNMYKFTQLKGEFSDLYRKTVFIYIDSNKKELIDITEFELDNLVNTRNMCCNKFLSSNFFKKNQAEIIMNMGLIIKNKRKSFDLNDKSCYKVLNSVEFLTSEFAKKNYKEIYNTLNQIEIDKENKNTNNKKKELKNK